MNFITEVSDTEAELELKYCERCGGLFLRVAGVSLIYCGVCKLAVAKWLRKAKTEMVTSARVPRRAKICRARTAAGPLRHRIDSLQGVGIREVRPC